MNTYNDLKKSKHFYLIKDVRKNLLLKKIDNFLLAEKEENDTKLVLNSKPYSIIIEPTNSVTWMSFMPNRIRFKNKR